MSQQAYLNTNDEENYTELGTSLGQVSCDHLHAAAGYRRKHNWKQCRTLNQSANTAMRQCVSD